MEPTDLAKIIRRVVIAAVLEQHQEPAPLLDALDHFFDAAKVAQRVVELLELPSGPEPSGPHEGV